LSQPTSVPKSTGENTASIMKVNKRHHNNSNKRLHYWKQNDNYKKQHFSTKKAQHTNETHTKPEKYSIQNSNSFTPSPEQRLTLKPHCPHPSRLLTPFASQTQLPPCHTPLSVLSRRDK
jgi:hypothetical protein